MIGEFLDTMFLIILGDGVFVSQSLGGPTGYALNPARGLDPRVAHAILPIPGKGSSDWAYGWVPVVGPIIGGTMAAFLFNALPKQVRTDQVRGGAE